MTTTEDDGIAVTWSRPYRLVQLREGAADAQRRACKDCAYLTGYVNWWCKNESAREARGTSIPGISGCEHWEAPPVREPARVKLTSWWERAMRYVGIR